VRPRLEALEGRWAPAVLTVTTAADSGPGSLRQALLDANAAPGLDTINFSIGSGAQTIALSSPLPAVTDSVIIDGTTQPGWAGLPLVTLDGSGAGACHGLVLEATDCAVRGLTVTHFAGSGVLSLAVRNAFQGDFLLGNGLDGATLAGFNAMGGNLLSGNGRCGAFVPQGTGNCFLQGNRIGTDFNGTAARPNGQAGVVVIDSQDLASINGNLISGNGGPGVLVSGGGSGVGVFAIDGNRIGTDAAGAAALPNRGDGVVLLGAGGVNVTNDLISGNAGSGVRMVGGEHNLCTGDRIGTNAAGTAALANAGDGVTLLGAGRAVVGGSLISGNGGSGVLIVGGGGAQVQGNKIGTNAAGSAALPNALDGVTIANSFEATVGPTISNGGTGNLISGNGRVGVLIGGAGTTAVRVDSDMIGTDAAGKAALPNAAGGVVFYAGASHNGALNSLISGNTGNGVTVAGAGTEFDDVLNDRIGTDAAGTAALPNTLDGVAVLGGASNSRIGAGVGAGPPAPANNVISGNGRFGVLLSGAGTTGTLIQANWVGVGSDGSPLGNGSHGIVITGGAHDNTVGGVAAGQFAFGNQIANNGGDGVRVESGIDNAIESNSIHDNARLGINLVGGVENGFGVTANDLGQPPDTDTGANGLQNYPVITAVAAGAGGGTDITFTLDSTPNTVFRVEFFANAAADPSGFGEGQAFLGFATAATDAGGHFAGTAHVAAAVPAGQKVAATATDPAGNTSEFSADFPPPA
jgi:hypothetical protein